MTQKLLPGPGVLAVGLECSPAAYADSPESRQEGDVPFDAFISYSHAADGALAPAVQRALQTLARPWNRRRALEVFRDQTGLAVSPGLWSSICAGLDDSRHFVLLASPEAAESTWVNQEIVHWAGSHSIDRLLPVVTAGEWAWDSSTGDFDWDRSTAVPQALHGMFHEEPHFLDLRWARTETELDLRHSRFREAITQLAAPMHGVSPEDLESSDVARFRHLVRLRRAVVAVLCTLLLLVSVAGVLAVQNAQEAQQQQHNAQEQQALAEQQASRRLSLQLLAQAKGIANQQKTLSLLLTAEATRLAPTEAWGSLVTGLDDTPGLARAFDPPVRAKAGATAAVDVDAKIYASVPQNGEIQPTIQLWELDTGQPIGPVDQVTGEQHVSDDDYYGFSLTQLAFSPNGTLAALYRCFGLNCVPADEGAGPSARRTLGGIEVLDVATGKGRLLPDSAASANLTFSHAGDRLAATGPDGKVRVWDVATHRIEVTANPPSPGEPTALAFSADDTRLALSEKDDGHILIWDLNSPRSSDPVEIPFPVGDYPQDVAFGSDLLASRDNDGRVHLWQVESGKSARQLETGGKAVADIAFGPDGTLATAGRDGSLRLWDVDRREQEGSARPSGLRRAGAEVTFDHEGALVSIGSDIRYWDTPRWGQIGEELYHQGAVTALTVSSDGVVASGDEHGVIRLWNLASGQPWSRPLRAQPGAVTALAFSSAGMLAAGGEDGVVQLWDIATGHEVQGPLNSHGGTVASLAFSPGGATLAAGYSKGQYRILIWKVATGSVIERLNVGQSGGVASVAFGPGGVFASAGADSLAFWDVKAWQSTKLDNSRGAPYTAVAFASDGQTLASGATRVGAHDNRTVALWKMPSGHPLGAPLDAGRTRAEARSFRSLAFSPDGNLLAGAGAGGVQLWDVSLHQPLGGRLGASPAISIAVSPDGRQVIAGDEDGVVQSYPATTDGWLRDVCAVVSRNLTQNEWDSYVGSETEYHRTCPQYPEG